MNSVLIGRLVSPNARSYYAILFVVLFYQKKCHILYIPIIYPLYNPNIHYITPNITPIYLPIIARRVISFFPGSTVQPVETMTHGWFLAAPLNTPHLLSWDFQLSTLSRVSHNKGCGFIRIIAYWRIGVPQFWGHDQPFKEARGIPINCVSRCETACCWEFRGRIHVLLRM